MIDDYARSGAPGALEDVRQLLNSWHIPNDTRLARDDLPEWAREPHAWGQRFVRLPHPRTASDLTRLTRTRDAVRALVNDDAAACNALLAATPPTMTIQGGQIAFALPESPADTLMVLVLDGITAGTLTRLRTCADCGWAFYDTSRNNRRRWCAMSPHLDGRGCGAAAKARVYRQRQHDKT